jgi:hypothetical protein
VASVPLSGDPAVLVAEPRIQVDVAELGVGPQELSIPGEVGDQAVAQALVAVRTIRVGRVIREVGKKASQVLVAPERSLSREGLSSGPKVSVVPPIRHLI